MKILFTAKKKLPKKHFFYISLILIFIFLDILEMSNLGFEPRPHIHNRSLQALGPYLVCVNLYIYIYISGGTHSLKLIPNEGFCMNFELMNGNFIYSSSFCHNLLKRSQRRIFFHISLCWKYQAWELNRVLTH